jgi:hypothetical protein
MLASTEIEIVKRLIRPESGNLPVEVARFFLGVHLDPADRAKMEDLNVKANRGTLTPPEERELDSLLRVCNSLSILHAKARLSLQAQNSAA